MYVRHIIIMMVERESCVTCVMIAQQDLYRNLTYVNSCTCICLLLYMYMQLQLVKARYSNLEKGYVDLRLFPLTSLALENHWPVSPLISNNIKWS